LARHLTIFKYISTYIVLSMPQAGRPAYSPDINRATAAGGRRELR
jgi:hypothetical protein